MISAGACYSVVTTASAHHSAGTARGWSALAESAAGSQASQAEAFQSQLFSDETNIFINILPHAPLLCLGACCGRPARRSLGMARNVQKGWWHHLHCKGTFQDSSQDRTRGQHLHPAFRRNSDRKESQPLLVSLLQRMNGICVLKRVPVLALKGFTYAASHKVHTRPNPLRN